MITIPKTPGTVVEVVSDLGNALAYVRQEGGLFDLDLGKVEWTVRDVTPAEVFDAIRVSPVHYIRTPEASRES